MDVEFFRAMIQHLPIERKFYWLTLLWWETHRGFFTLDSVRIALLGTFLGSLFLPSVPVALTIILCIVCLVTGVLIGYALARQKS